MPDELTASPLFDPTPYTEQFDLADRFGIPPFTVLDRRQGYWQERRAEWDTLGFNSSEGRSVAVYEVGNTQAEVANRIKATGKSPISTFDPVLCEAVYRWWCPLGGRIIDPFAGGSVRGIVAARLGRAYTGIDVRQEQLDANYLQALALLEQGQLEDCPDWVLGDATAGCPPGPYDLLFTCPPYGDLERYSDDPDDISTMSWPRFQERYTAALDHAGRQLSNNRFAVVVVSNYRDRSNVFRDLVGTTIRAMHGAGCAFHAELILVQPVGSAMLRASFHFPKRRRPTRLHDTVLVFVKGAADLAAKAAEPVRPRTDETAP